MTKRDLPESSLAARVYRALLEIPGGRVTTYGRLGERVGCRSARAVGQALSRNPDAPRVPCHRVVRADGSLAGYSGSLEESEVGTKRRLLAEEGVIFLPDGRVDLARCGWWM